MAAEMVRPGDRSGRVDLLEHVESVRLLAGSLKCPFGYAAYGGLLLRKEKSPPDAPWRIR